MVIKTLIIGFTPLNDTTGQKPRAIRDDAYMKELLAKFEIGEVHFATYSNWQETIRDLDPIVIIVFGEYYAQQVKDIKSDALVYLTDDPGSIFYRKAETEAKKEHQKKVFSEIAGIVKQIQEGGEKELSSVRKFAAMSFQDMYDMIVQAIIGDDKKLREQAWGLLNDNSSHKDFVWMRVKLICEVWDHGDGKHKEQFMCMTMNQHIDNGIARKMQNFTDEYGQVFHQYMFTDFWGRDLNYIRRIPFGEKGQDKYAYEAILNKYETPIGPRVMLEAGEMRKKREEYTKKETKNL